MLTSTLSNTGIYAASPLVPSRAERTAEGIAARRRKPNPACAEGAAGRVARPVRAGRPPEVPKMTCASAPAYEPIASPRGAVPASPPRRSSQPHARRTPSACVEPVRTSALDAVPYGATPPKPNRPDVLPAARRSRRHTPQPIDSRSPTTGVSLESWPPHSARSPITTQRFRRRRTSPAHAPPRSQVPRRGVPA
jgi:hypothetical protein